VSVSAPLSLTFVDCSSILFGCLECSRESGKKFLSYTDTDAIVCRTCDFDMYLLEFDNANTQYLGYVHAHPDFAPSDSTRLATCVRRCEDVAGYVSNPNTGRCEYCGPHCTHCTLQYGCSDCGDGPHGPMMKSAEAYERVSGVGNLPSFPYNYYETTKYGGPSSEFRVCYDCDQVDERCTECDGATATQCGKCHDWVQAPEQQLEQEHCKLYDSDMANCLQANPEDAAQCVACKPGFYPAEGRTSCVSCKDTGQGTDSGCRVCD
jgi:hypothetical protein